MKLLWGGRAKYKQCPFIEKWKGTNLFFGWCNDQVGPPRSRGKAPPASSLIVTIWPKHPTVLPLMRKGGGLYPLTMVMYEPICLKQCRSLGWNTPQGQVGGNGGLLMSWRGTTLLLQDHRYHHQSVMRGKVLDFDRRIQRFARYRVQKVASTRFESG